MSTFTIRQSSLGASPPDQSQWQRYGLAANPFPPSGVQGAILYTGHMPYVISGIQDWLQTACDTPPGGSRRPLALEGTIGAGKTHLLTAIERDASAVSGVVVVRESLVNAGGGKLLLSTLLGNNLKLGEIANAVVTASNLRTLVSTTLPSSSPLHAGLAGSPSRDTLSLWLRGARLTQAQLRPVGGRSLDGEGERLRAVLHLLKLAAAVGHLKVLIFMLDQLEDLDVKGEVTPLKRARFLTDLRILIDEALSEGAPVSLCMAWNNNSAGSFMRSLTLQYPALAARISLKLSIPALTQGHLLPFAQAYIGDALSSASADSKRRALKRLSLDQSTLAILVGRTQKLPGGDIAPREWLHTLWAWAEEAVKAQ